MHYYRWSPLYIKTGPKQGNINQVEKREDLDLNSEY